RRLLNRTLSGTEYTCTLAADSAEARKCLAKQPFDLALCDVNMPGESGVDLARHIASEYEDTAVIILTAVDDPKTADAALEAGIYGYIIKPFNPNELTINIRNALRRRKLEISNRMYRQDLEKMVEDRTVRLQGALEGIIQAMVRTVESRDPYTAGHQQRVAELAVAIAIEMNIPKNQIEGIRMAGRIHDLGKISVPAEILSKPTRLTDIEFALIKTHSRIGYDILKEIDFPWPIAQMVLQHHEKMNGSGYPQGLSGEDILLEARVLCVADVVEAMASHRPYRPALGIEKALDEISENKGVFYDPEVVGALFRLKTSEIEKILR
ncbi:MAG: response regulator, partial [Deltaproteobacteria bacterium]|nr:response regulator [Deltaproteobacteria bacterium]